MAICELTSDEQRWCRRLERVLKAKPRRLYVYVGQNSVDIMFTEDVRSDDDREMARKLGEITKYTILAKIEGDASSL